MSWAQPYIVFSPLKQEIQTLSHLQFLTINKFQKTVMMILITILMTAIQQQQQIQ